MTEPLPAEVPGPIDDAAAGFGTTSQPPPPDSVQTHHVPQAPRVEGHQPSSLSRDVPMDPITAAAASLGLGTVADHSSNANADAPSTAAGARAPTAANITPTACLYCTVGGMAEVDTVKLDPCGCRVCKDCFIQFLAEHRFHPRLPCRSCHGHIMGHHGARRHPLPLTSTETVPQTAGAGALNGVTPGTPEPVDLVAAGQIEYHYPPPPPLGPAKDNDSERAAVATIASLARRNKSSKSAASGNKKSGANTKSPSSKKRGRAAKEDNETEDDNNEDHNSSKKGKRVVRTRLERIQDLALFKARYGHCHVRRGHDEYRSLFRWMDEVRAGRVQLNEDERTKIDDLGFSWDKVEDPQESRRRGTSRNPTSSPDDVGTKKNYKSRKTFEQRLQDFVTYKERFQVDDVPYRPRESQFQSLGEWVKDIRRGHLKVTMDQRKMLNAVGFNWETKTNRLNREWKAQLEKVRKYAEEHGGDCHIPYNYHDKSLREWINTQRKINNKGNLRPDRKKALEAIGFAWTGHGTNYAVGGGRTRRQPQEDPPVQQQQDQAPHHQGDGEHLHSENAEEQGVSNTHTNHHHNPAWYPPLPPQQQQQLQQLHNEHQQQHQIQQLADQQQQQIPLQHDPHQLQQLQQPHQQSNIAHYDI